MSEHGGHDHGHGHGHGHGDHAGHAAVYRRRFWITLILALPVVVYSDMIQDWFGFTAPQFPGDGLVAPVLGTVVFVYGGWVFLAGALDEVRGRAQRGIKRAKRVLDSPDFSDEERQLLAMIADGVVERYS